MISYDYTELIQEIYSELEYGSLKLTDTIQVLRDKGEYAKQIGYSPIKDWYYSHDRQMYDLTLDFLDDVNDIKIKRELLANYELYRASLEEISVEEMLNEMKEKSAILQ